MRPTSKSCRFPLKLQRLSLFSLLITKTISFYQYLTGTQFCLRIEADNQIILHLLY